MQDDPLSHKIIGCAYKVGSTIGSGFLESVYQKSMEIELKAAGLTFTPQKEITVYYNQEPVGDFIADFLVEDQLIIELKAVRQIHPIHELQLLNYLKATRITTGLLINFGETGVDIKRKSRTHNS
jgi:GxxExxY protein